MNKFQVGDQVLAPYGSHIWPGRITKIDVMADVKLYKIKIQIKVPIASLIPHDDGEEAKEVLRRAEGANNKMLMLAVKMSKMQKMGERGKIGNLPVAPLVKQQQENNHCKQEEEEEHSNSLLLGKFQSASAFLLSLDEKAVLQECRQNKPSVVMFFNTTTNATERVLKIPKLVVTFFLENYLNELMDGNQEKYRGDKMTLHRKIVNIIGYHVIDLSVMLRTQLRKNIGDLVNQFKQKGGDKIMEKTVTILVGLQKQIEEQFNNQLEDYTCIALSLKPISGLLA